MEITISLPETVEFESRDVAFTFDFRNVPEAMLPGLVVNAVLAGITKSGIDSGSDAAKYAAKFDMTVEAATEELVGKWIAARETGTWTRIAGLSESSDVREGKALLRPVVKAGDPKGYKNASPEKRDEMVEAAWAALTDAVRETYLKAGKAEAERKAAEARAKAERKAALVADLAKAVTVNL